VQGITGTPQASLVTGLVVAVVLLGVALVFSDGADWLGFFSFLMRWLHVLAAMVWIGLIFFVNFVQLVALQSADEGARGYLHKAIVPNVAWWFRHASTVTVVTGVILVFAMGYALPTLVYGSAVYVPLPRALLLWSAVIGALVMWMFVHMYIWPNMQVVLGLRPGDAEAKAHARARVILFARLNLVIALPVTLGMVAAAHLY
jgi:uncharacterized membrane protein